MLVLEDKTNRLTIDEITSNHYQRAFYTNNLSILNIGISDATYWLKVSISYPDIEPNAEPLKQWYLEVASTQLDIAELYLPEVNGIYSIQRSDVRELYRNRPITHINSVFPINLKLGEEVTAYIKIKKSTSIRIPLTLWTPKGFIQKVAVEEFIYGFFYGSMFILLLYNMYLFFAVRDESYLYYVLYLGGVTVFTLLEVGHGLVHVEKYLGSINREYLVFIIWEIAIASAYFGKIFMALEKNHPKLNAMLNIFFAIAIASVLVSFIFDYNISVNWAASYNSIFMPTYIGIAFYLWMKGNENARYFFLAWVANVIGFMVFAGVTYQILPSTTLTLAVTPVGILIEAVTLSFALANRIKNQQMDKIRSDKNTIKYMVHYQSVFNNAREGIYKMDLRGRVLHANPAMVQLFGFSSPEELKRKGLEVASMIFEDPTQQFYELLDKGDSSNRLCLENPEGKPVWVVHKTKLIHNVDGEVSHIEGVIHNVTQQQLKSIAISQREAELNEKRIAEDSMRKKGEFLSNMNHEIRTPLTAVIGFSESLSENSLSKTEKRNTINHIVSNSHTLLRLINDILDFSKLEADKLYIEEINTQTLDLLYAIQSEFLPKAKKKGVGFCLELKYPVPSIVLGDPTRIRQILTNLCSNAVKFTDSGSVSLVVAWDNQIPGLVFEVVDCGLGIDTEAKKRLFGVFDQADSSSTRKHGGAGLGLAISRKLAIKMGGDITVSSQPGKGSRFTFTVPVKLPSDLQWIENANAFEQKVSKNQSSIPKLDGTVLLAEDNVVNQKLIQKILMKSGVEVIIVSNGIEVCEICDDTLPDFVLMDINMPKRNGLEATKYLRSRNYDIPIYALTAESSKEEIDRTIAAGCNGFLGKPLNRELLYNAMEVHLPQRLD